jgi:hypothetical protein
MSPPKRLWKRWYTWAGVAACLVFWCWAVTERLSVQEIPKTVDRLQTRIEVSSLGQRDRSDAEDKLYKALKLSQQEEDLDAFAKGLSLGFLTGFLGWTCELLSVWLRKHARRT